MLTYCRVMVLTNCGVMVLTYCGVMVLTVGEGRVSFDQITKEESYLKLLLLSTCDVWL